MQEKYYGKRKHLYGVVERSNGRIEVHVYHSNRSLLPFIRNNSSNPRYFLAHRDAYSKSEWSAANALAEIVSDYSSHFHNDLVDFVLPK